MSWRPPHQIIGECGGMGGHRRFRLVMLLVMLGVIITPLLGVAQADAPTEETPPSIDHAPANVSTQFQPAGSPEQQLADRYAPIVYLRQINRDICDTENEGFDPVSVDFVLEQPDIPLMDTENGRPTGRRRTIAETPSASDLFGLDEPHFLDFPGSPVRPRCDYRRYFGARAARGEVEHVAYAHIYLEPGTDELALQYWLFYYFNDWNNQHEGDWEMIMLFFDATTVEEALASEPTRTVYAQHGGGERADWDDDKLSKEEGRPVVYVARGAHASFYEQHTYLGLAENGTGFGCETTKGPHRRIPLNAVVIPHEPAGPDDPFAWLAFTGRWGEFRRSEWNGPTGPNAKTSWTAPVTWAEGVRDTSLIVPEFEGFGSSPIGFFCGVVGGGSRVLVAFTRTPMLVLGGLGIVAVAIGWIYSTASTPIRQAFAYYRGNFRTFGAIGAVLLPIGYILAMLQTIIFHVPPVEPLFNMLQRFPGLRIVVVLALGSVQAVIAVIFVAPAIIWAMSEHHHGHPASVIGAYRHGLPAIVPILDARIRVVYRAILNTLTIVRQPRAIQQLIRAIFIGQAVVHEHDGPLAAINDSARAVNVNLKRTLLTQISLTVVVLLTGPLVALILLLALPSRPLEFINYISSIVFALLYPLTVIGMTLLYFDQRAGVGEREDVVTGEVTENAPVLIPGSSQATS